MKLIYFGKTSKARSTGITFGYFDYFGYKIIGIFTGITFGHFGYL